MLITDISVISQSFSTDTWLDRQRVSTPMSVFPRFAERRSSWRGPGADLVSVWVQTDGEAYGIGQTRGGAVTAAFIEHHLKPLLIGQDPRHVVRRTEEMRRAASPYARGGVLAMGTAAVELALWDLVARAMGAPLTALLGGHHEPLNYYLTCANPEAVATLDTQLLDGAAAIKVPATYGPAFGRSGLESSIELITSLRRSLPSGLPIAIDCFMSWDLEFATRFALGTADLGVTWIEEPFSPNDLASYAELRRRVAPTRVAGGEHLFDLSEATTFMESACIDLLQTDLTWFGGLRNSLVVATAAEALGLIFAPHGGGLQPWAVHLVAACGPTALVEVMVGVTDHEVAAPRASTEPGVGLTPDQVGFGVDDDR